MNRYSGVPFYRTEISPGLTTFRVVVKQTDLLIAADRDLTGETLEVVRRLRRSLELYILNNPVFLRSLKPLPFDESAPELVRTMLVASKRAGVGPMASVAGAIAEAVGRELIASRLARSIAVENGGDIFLYLQREARIKVFVDNPSFSGLKIVIPSELQPCGVCTSSGKIGHSLSFGKADAVTVVAKDTAFADATATALGNLLASKKDLKFLEREVKRRNDLLGVLVVLEDQVFIWGKVRLI